MEEALEFKAAIPVGNWSPELGRLVTVGDLLAAAPFDGGDRPPAGTECAPCRQLGHYCPAKGYSGEFALCLACGSDEACEQLAAVERFRRPSFDDAELFIADGDNAPREGRVLEISDADRVVPEERPVASAWTAKASLDPGNLKRGLTGSAKISPRMSREAATRERGLAKRIAKTKAPARVAVLRTRVAPLRAAKVLRTPVAPDGESLRSEESVMVTEKVVRVYASRVCECGCGESYVPTGVRQSYKEGHVRASAVKKARGGYKQKIKAALVTVAVPANIPDGSPQEMVTLRVPVTALDRLLLMLPAKVKASAMEKLLGELG